MKYPKYTREQNKSCKLTDEQIHDIKLLGENGISNYAIAELFNVSETAIYYWLLTPKERKAKNRKYYLSTGKQRDIDNRDAKHEKQNRSRVRKYKMPEYKEYLKEIKKRSFNKNKLKQNNGKCKLSTTKG